MQSVNKSDDKNEAQSESSTAVKFSTFKDEIPNLVRERNVSFSKDLENVTIPLDGPNSQSSSDISHTVSMVLKDMCSY